MHSMTQDPSGAASKHMSGRYNKQWWQNLKRSGIQSSRHVISLSFCMIGCSSSTSCFPMLVSSEIVIRATVLDTSVKIDKSTQSRYLHINWKTWTSSCRSSRHPPQEQHLGL